MIRSRSTTVALLLWATAASGCGEPTGESPPCTDRGAGANCLDVIAACASKHGVLPGDLCRQACQAGGDKVYVCWATPTGDRGRGLVPKAKVEEKIGLELDLLVSSLGCDACGRWPAESECVPSLAFCDPADGSKLLLCSEDGTTSSPAGECAEGAVCLRPGCVEGKPCGVQAICAEQRCDPGVVECGGPGEELVRACDAVGAGYQVLMDCRAAGRTTRCGPEPVCAPADGRVCDSDESCGPGFRCTLPGESDVRRVCVAAAGLGEPCLGDVEAICEVGLRCVVEHEAPDDRPAHGICREQCDFTLNDCGGGRACLRAPGGGVCSNTVDARHRDNCNTGLPTPCDIGVVVAGTAECVPLIPPAGAEVCDEVDNDCDGETDEDYDLSTDPYHCGGCGNVCLRDTVCSPLEGNPELGACVCPEGFVDTDGDKANGCECPLTNGGVEACDRRDNDCDGEIDEGFDVDADGFPSSVECGDEVPIDCDDDDELSFPGARERCDGKDNDCDGRIDETFDLSRDPDHCGKCGHSCRVPNVNVLCVEGDCPWECEPEADPRCGLQCLPGAVDENLDPLDGCEVTACTLERPPPLRVEDRFELDAPGAAGMTWRAPGQAFIYQRATGEAQPLLRPFDWDEGAIEIFPGRPMGEVAAPVFDVISMAWAERRLVAIDGSVPRIVIIEPDDLLEITSEPLPPPPVQGAVWSAIAHDESAYWIGESVNGGVMRLVPGLDPVGVFVAGGPLHGLVLLLEARLALAAVGDLVCAHRMDGGVCAACYAPPPDRGAPGPIAWDGEHLWLLDPSAPALYRTTLDLPQP